ATTGCGSGASMTASLEAPLIGFRVWVVSSDGRVRSLAGGAEWPGPHPLEARCHLHAAPAAGCRCGLYAVDSVRTAERYVGVRDWSASCASWIHTALLVLGTAFALLVASSLGWVVHGALQPAPVVDVAG